jgi:membrane protease YdiL (CAAX protease family)
MKHLRCLAELLFLLFLWFIGITAIYGIPVGVLSSILFPEVDVGSSFFDVNPDNITRPWFLFVSTVLQLIGTLIAVYLFCLILHRNFKELGFSPKGRLVDIGWGVLYGGGAIVAGFLILLACGLTSVEWGDVDLPTMLIWLVILLFAAMMEEVLCRGGMILICLRYYNKGIAVLVPALIFSIMHILNSDYSWISFCNIFLAGIFMGIYYVYHRNLWFPLALHLAWNYFQGPILGFQVSGTATPQMLIQHQHGSTLWTGGAFGFEGSVIGLIVLAVASFAVFLHFRRKEEYENDHTGIKQ